MIEPLPTANPPRTGSAGLDAQTGTQTGAEPSYLPAPDLEELGERIAVLSAQIQAATYHLLVMIREFDERTGWNCGVSDYGFRSCAHWLNWRTGLEMGAAREKVRIARALGELPKISEAMRHGELSFSKVRALTRVATADNEAELLEFGKAGTASHVEKLVRAWRRVDRIGELEQENLRRASRYLHAHTDEDGMVVLRARLEPEVGAALLKALEAASEVLYRQDQEEEGAEVELAVSAEQRRADAMGLVAEAALGNGLDNNGPGNSPSNGLDSSARGERYQVVVHVDANVLEEPGVEESGVKEPGLSMLEEGQNVSAETSRRIACDSSKVVMKHDSEGRILDVGRRTRTISAALRRALSHRDQSCQFPGCDVRHCDAHHLEHWANGGETNLENLVLLCRRHHRTVHEGGFRVERSRDGELRFFRPDGKEMPAAPGVRGTEPKATKSETSGARNGHRCRKVAVSPLSASTDPLADPLADPLGALAARLLGDGVVVDADTGFPTWDGKPLNLAWAVDGYRGLGSAD